MTDIAFAPGMEAAMAQHERFASDAEAAAYWADGAPDVPIEDGRYAGGAGQAQAFRLYRGARPTPAPTLIYIHGGGWAAGSIALNESACRRLAARSGWTVFSVSYRLAPAHPFPAGLDDCRAAWRHAVAQAGALGLDPTRIAIGGASAGANLALAAALAEDRAALCGLVLIYGVFGADLGTPSYRRYDQGPGLTRADMAAYFDLYDPERRRNTEPLIAPLLADLTGLPPACLVIAEHDVLRSDSETMADRMTSAGVAVQVHLEKGVTHGYINRGRLVPSVATSVDAMAAFLDTAARR